MGFGILFSAPEGKQESVTVTINKNPESKFHWHAIWNPIYLESGIHLTRSVESRIQECLLLPYVGPVAHPGEGPAGSVSRLFLDQTEARSAEKKFLRPGPPSIRVWMTPPPPRLFLDQTEARSVETKFLRPGPPSIRVWMTPPPSPLIWRSESATGGNTIPCDSLNFLYIKYERRLVIQMIHSRDFSPLIFFNI